ncbi:hypothetical protein [Microcystis aeruginosa]|nr:hypothetical protein [Microcystis aeruginosa]
MQIILNPLSIGYTSGQAIDNQLLISSHAKLITCPIELKPLRGNDRHV